MQRYLPTKKSYNVVFDIGKLNAKILLFDEHLNIKKLIKTQYPIIKIKKNFFLKDINFLILWFKKNLFLLSKKFKIIKIVTSSHGAAFGLVDNNDQPVFGVMDYENNFNSVSKEFKKIKPSFSESLSPDSDRGLSLGKQLLYLKLKKRFIFNKTKYILTLPQYISWIFSKKPCSEISFLGNQTHLWNHKNNSFSSLVTKMKIRNKLPPIKKAWKKIGFYLLDERIKDNKIKVINGIHDSDASYLLFAKSKFKKFNLVSSGTQIVVMNSFTSSKCLVDGKEMYAGLDVFGKVVPTIRFMGGREYEILNKKLKIKKYAKGFDQSFFKKNKYLYPSFGVGGPFGKIVGNCNAFINENYTTRHMAIITYIAFVLNYCMDLINCKENIIITGPLVNNFNILKILNSLRSKQKIYLISNQEGTGIGASLLFDIEKKYNVNSKLYKHNKILNINSSYEYWLLNLKKMKII